MISKAQFDKIIQILTDNQLLKEPDAINAYLEPLLSKETIVIKPRNEKGKCMARIRDAKTHRPQQCSKGSTCGEYCIV